uniref:Sugar phosphate transporter domain-containing protein n=1 Tax=Lotus japonicus TaxID=34305 RepID=I3T1K1_LOTJA|nr:unknown [Lotus japonicus]
MCHMTACSLLSYICHRVDEGLCLCRPFDPGFNFFKISALSLIFCVSVVFGNISLRYLPVSFNQAIGATTPFFTAVFAYIMTFKREAWLTYLTLVPVVTGVVIASGVCNLRPLLFSSFVVFHCVIVVQVLIGDDDAAVLVIMSFLTM